MAAGVSRNNVDFSLDKQDLESATNRLVERQKRQSLRVRPSQYFNNDEPPSPLKDQSLPTDPLRPQTPKMSLFNLFSRPKVEKQRGYAERGLEVPHVVPPLRSRQKTYASTPNLLAPSNLDDAQRLSTTSPLPSPTPTAPARTPSRLKFLEPTKAPQQQRNTREQRSGPFVPPPLFQAYPQATKDGVLEVSTSSVENAQQKAKSRRLGQSHERPLEDYASSTYTNKSRMTLRHSPDDAQTNASLPRKVFVLVTSGYLLQYAESGPSNRLPERVLQLGKDSAAFASDLVPGKHHVLQVSHAVTGNGTSIGNSGSLFSKLGLRSAATKQKTSSLLLVMQSAAELGSWMIAIRREIDLLGEKTSESTVVRPTSTHEAETGTSDLQETPSHRFQVKRDPSKIDRVDLPKTTAETEALDDDLDSATIDDIEKEASKLDEDVVTTPARNRSPSDAPSLSSSTAVSVDQAQLNSLRSSESNSIRTSNTSHSASPVATPLDSSLSAESERSPALSLDMSDKQTPPSRLPFRPLASYTAWRRSNLHSAAKSSALNRSPSKQTGTIVEESSLAETNIPVIDVSPSKVVSAARSEPNLRNTAHTIASRNSKCPTPLPPVPVQLSAVSTTSGRTALAGQKATGPRDIVLKSASMQSLHIQEGATRSTVPRVSGSVASKRISFSMPIKINPSDTQAEQSSSSSHRRRSQLHDPDAAGETPIVHTLTAVVDSNSRTSLVQPADRVSSASLPDQMPSTRASAARPRYSVLAETSPSPPLSALLGHTSISSSLGASHQHIQAQLQGRMLRRPTSMQVRSDRAPFLSTVRNSATLDARAIPIRGMKPSRSASNIAGMATQHNERMTKSATPTLPEEEAVDLAMPLPDRSVSPLPPRPGSRTSGRKSLRTRSSLPELDLGIPVVGLGPPAPPPSAPLPLPPSSASHAPSPTPGPVGPPPSGPLPATPPVQRAISPSDKLTHPTQRNSVAPGSRPTSPGLTTAALSAGIATVAGLGIQVS